MSDIRPITELSPIQLDALKEIGNIGAGSSATAFAQFLGRKIEMSVPEVNVVELTEVPEIFGGAEVTVIGITLRVFGQAPGHMLFLLEQDSAFKLIEVLGLSTTTNFFSEMEISALKEIVNILSGSYLNAFNQMTGFVLTQSVPAFAIDMAGAILGTFMIEFGQFGDHGLLVETQFKVNQEEIHGNLCFIPNQGSLNSILNAIGLGAYYADSSS